MASSGNYKGRQFNLALPATARELDVTTTNLQWAIAVYQLTLASILIPGGRHFNVPTINSTAAAIAAISMNENPSSHMSAPMPGW